MVSTNEGDRQKDSPQDYREILYTVDKRGRRKWVYATFVNGFFRKQRAIVTFFLMAFYLAMPWVTIRGEQGVLLDIAHRKFIFLGTVFLATDTIYLFLVLAILALVLFFSTAVLGRVWCGWACPETVFLEFLFRPIERWIEGDHLAQRRLDAGPWNVEKIKKKLLKHAISASIAWVIASTFLAYFVGREPLIEMMLHPPWENMGMFLLTLAFMGIMGFQFGWFREQFCTVVCPYGRFQSVLLDQQSMVIGYDQKRGEPRGKIQRQHQSGAGDCIDCHQCVRVCPTGIDIRNGLQMECVNCTACIDACDSVMEKIGKPKGLVRYASQAELEGKKQKFLRPRVLVYGSFLVILSAVFLFKISTRDLSEFQILRGSGAEPFTLESEGMVRNQLRMKIMNKGTKDAEYRVFLSRKNSDIQLILPMNPYPVVAGKTETVPLFVQFPESLLNGGRKKVILVLENELGYHSNQEVTLIGPGK